MTISPTSTSSRVITPSMGEVITVWLSASRACSIPASATSRLCFSTSRFNWADSSVCLAASYCDLSSSYLAWAWSKVAWAMSFDSSRPFCRSKSRSDCSNEASSPARFAFWLAILAFSTSIWATWAARPASAEVSRVSKSFASRRTRTDAWIGGFALGSPQVTVSPSS